MSRPKGTKNTNTQEAWVDQFATYDIATQKMLLLALGTIHRTAVKVEERKHAPQKQDEPKQPLLDGQS